MTMDPSQLDDVLNRSRKQTETAENQALPSDFASEVVRCGRRRLRDRLTRRVLAGSSMAAVVLAAGISFILAESMSSPEPESAPPALSMFQSRGDLPLVSR